MPRAHPLIWCMCWALGSVTLAPALARAQDDHALPPEQPDQAQVQDVGEADALTRLATRKAAEAPPPVQQDEPDTPKKPDTPDQPERADAPPDPYEQQPLGSLPAGARRPRSGGDEGPGPIGSSWVLSTITALGAVLGLILLFRLLYTKITGHALAKGHSAALEVLTRVAVAPRSHILIVRLGQRILVLGDSANGLTPLATVDDPEEIATLLKSITSGQPNSITRGFSQLLHGFNNEYADDQLDVASGADGDEQRTGRARDEVSGLLSRVQSLARGAGR